MSKYIVIDGISYPVKIVSAIRRADTLDKIAYRTEDGILHRKVIGVYYNYVVSVGTENDLDLYDTLFEVLSAPVPSHSIKLPNEAVAQDRYVSSVQDSISRITDEGTLYKELSFNITCVAPTKKG